VGKRIVIAVIAVALIAAGAMLVLHTRRAIARLPTPDRPPFPVATALVKDGAVADTLQTLAVVQPDRSSTVAALVQGTLLEVRGREGDRIAAGQLMARIDARVLQDAVEAAQARLGAADEDLRKQQMIFERDKSLFASRDIPQQTFDVSKAQLEASRASKVVAQRAYESALTSRGYADVTAPYSGVITARLVEPGDVAAPGKPLFSLQVQGHVRVLSKVSQDVLSRLRVGCAVTFSANGQTLVSRVSRIYPALDAARLGIVETDVDVAPFGLPSGATLAASYSAAPASGMVVPASALLQGLKETLVVRVQGGVTEAVPVTVTGRSTSEATVVGALQPGQAIVVGLPSELMALSSGARVSVTER
jgi:multidrug efflux system membrane fusion protein